MKFEKFNLRFKSETLNETIIPFISISFTILSLLYSGVLWSSILFYSLIIFFLVFYQKDFSNLKIKSFITIFLILTTFLASNNDSMNLSPFTKDYFSFLMIRQNFLIYTIKIILVLYLTSIITTSFDRNFRVVSDLFFSSLLVGIFVFNSYFESGRFTFNMGFDRYLPNWTAAYLYIYLIFCVRCNFYFSFFICLTFGFLTVSRNFFLAIFIVIIGYMILPFLKRYIFRTTHLLIISYLFVTLFCLLTLEHITLGNLSSINLIGHRISEFSPDTPRLLWNLQGLDSWVSSINNLVWGYGNWPDDGPNPHNALIHSLVEHGLIPTALIIFFIFSILSKDSNGVEPWIIGFFVLSSFLHLTFFGMYWILLIFVSRIRMNHYGFFDVISNFNFSKK
jgi:hypothetical protein